jgi:hypothetical protein
MRCCRSRPTVEQRILFSFVRVKYISRDSSVGISMGYELDARGIRVQFLEGVSDFSLPHNVQTTQSRI